MISARTFGPLFVAALVMTFSSGCKKDAPYVPSTPPVTAKGQVKIVLNRAYLHAGLVDSAFLIWAVPGGFDSLAFHVEDSNLVLSPKALPGQEADYRISLMTSIKLSGASLKWDRRFRARVDSASHLSFDAPKNFGDGEWLPRVILNDHTGLIAFSGIRTSDPHFTLFRIDASWRSVEFDRSHWDTRGGVQRVSGGVWSGNDMLDAKGMYENESFFVFLPEQTGTRNYNHIEIFILFSTADNSQMRGLSFTHDL